MGYLISIGSITCGLILIIHAFIQVKPNPKYPWWGILFQIGWGLCPIIAGIRIWP
jgi:hypothetical protein